MVKASWAKVALFADKMSEGMTTLTVDDPPALTLAGLAEHVSAPSSAVDGCAPGLCDVERKLLQPRAIEPENAPTEAAFTVKLTVLPG
jgi:hypothetical protein